MTVVKEVKYFCWTSTDAYEMINAHLNDTCTGDVHPPKDKQLKVCARALLLFKERYGDKFMVLKNDHMTGVLERVRLVDAERGDMVTMVGRTQSDLLIKFGILFE